MKKIKDVQNCLKWRENWSKIIVGIFLPTNPHGFFLVAGTD